MQRAILFCCLFFTAGCATTASHDWARISDGSLNEWLAEDAIPGLTETFTQHPRFKGETIRIAALDGERVAGRADGLTIAVGDALHSALMQTAGLNIVRVTGPESCATAPRSGYYLAVDTNPSGSRNAAVQLKLFDIVEQQWISGFGHQWRGELSSSQRNALGRTIVAESARGQRVAPFASDQSDLLAESLAAELACHLKRNGSDELIIQPAKYRAAALIAGNLAGKHEIPVGANGVLVLETRVHKVDNDLYQVWAILTPDNTSAELSAIAVSAYAARPLLKADVIQQKRPSELAQVDVSMPQQVDGLGKQLLSNVTVMTARNRAECGSGSFWRNATRESDRDSVIVPGACFGLEIERHPETHVYLISHHADVGLVRIYPTACDRERPDFADALVRFPARQRAFSWDSRSGVESFHVVVAGSRRATRQLDSLMTQLPDNCRSTKRYNRTGKTWLKNIDTVAHKLGDEIAWESVRVYHQPRAAAQRLGEIRGVRR